MFHCWRGPRLLFYRGVHGIMDHFARGFPCIRYGMPTMPCRRPQPGRHGSRGGGHKRWGIGE